MVILAGIVSSYFIFKNSGPAAASSENGGISELSKQILENSPIKWIEKAKEQILTGDSVGNESSNFLNSSKQINFSELVASQMFGDMENMFQSGDSSTVFDPEDPNNKEAIQSAISGIKDPLSYYDLSIDEKAIKVLQDNSKEAKKNYLEGVFIVFSQNETDAYKNPTSAVDKAILLSDFSGLNQLVKTYQNLYNRFMIVSVPTDQLELHKRYLRFFKKAGIIYSGIGDIQNDPVKAGLFFEMVSGLINEEIEIGKEYYKLATGIDL